MFNNWGINFETVSAASNSLLWSGFTLYGLINREMFMAKMLKFVGASTCCGPTMGVKAEVISLYVGQIGPWTGNSAATS